MKYMDTKVTPVEQKNGYFGYYLVSLHVKPNTFF